MKNHFDFMLKAVFVLKIFRFLSCGFWSCSNTASSERLGYTQNFEITDSETNITIHIFQYLKKKGQPDNQIWSVIRN